MTEQEIREAFEKTINIHCRTRNEHGDYVMGTAQDAWCGFQHGYEAAQQRIQTLEAHVEKLRGAVGYAIKDTYPTEKYLWAISDDCCDTLEKVYGETSAHSLAHIKREALQRAVDICETVEPMPTYKAGGTATCRESDCYDIGIEECKEAIKKEMDGWDETV